MLKKFLKFLRGDSEEPEEFDGSYLADLLRRVEPRMVEGLDACPKHDPLPLLVAEILRESAGDQFKREIECPVTDAESASLEPPPPPDTVDEEEPPAAGPRSPRSDSRRRRPRKGHVRRGPRSS